MNPTLSFETTVSWCFYYSQRQHNALIPQNHYNPLHYWKKSNDKMHHLKTFFYRATKACAAFIIMGLKCSKINCIYSKMLFWKHIRQQLPSAGPLSNKPLAQMLPIKGWKTPACKPLWHIRRTGVSCLLGEKDFWEKSGVFRRGRERHSGVRLRLRFCSIVVSVAEQLIHHFHVLGLLYQSRRKQRAWCGWYD